MAPEYVVPTYLPIYNMNHVFLWNNVSRIEKLEMCFQTTIWTFVRNRNSQRKLPFPWEYYVPSVIILGSEAPIYGILYVSIYFIAIQIMTYHILHCAVRPNLTAQYSKEFNNCIRKKNLKPYNSILLTVLHYSINYCQTLYC